MQKKNILFLVTYYYPHWTGLTQTAINLAEGLDKNKYNVTVLTTKFDRPQRTSEFRNSVLIYRVKVLFRISRTLFSIELFWRIINLIRVSDKIVIFLPYAECAYVSLICKIFNKESILVYNGDLILPKGIFNRIVEFLYKLSTNYSIKICRTIMVHTQDYAEQSPVLNKYLNKIKYILPPIKTSDFSGISLDIPLFGKLGSDKVVGFAGRFVEEKGFDLLIDAIPHVISKMKNVKFIFAGETNINYELFYQKLKPKIDKLTDILFFIGKLDRKQMMSFYRKCKVFVISSRSEFLALTQVESMLSGTPVVCTNIPGARTPIKLTGMGILVESENPISLARGIISALDNRGRLIVNQNQIENVFSYKESIDQFSRLLE